MLVGTYNPSLVLVSLGVAILASYTALGMANRVRAACGQPAARYWLAGGAFAMGVGIWSMHFIGMLAFSLPIPMGYDLPLTLLSLAIAIGCSAFALRTVSRDELPGRRLAAGALLMGAGIAAMHYLGMAAMRMTPGIIYDAKWFALSILIAVGASGAALWITYRLRHGGPRMLWSRPLAAVVMGIAIVGMHYTGMAAAGFPEGSICMAANSGISAGWLAIAVTAVTLSVLVIALLVAVLDNRMEERTSALASSLAEANEELVQLALHDTLTKLPNRILLEDRLEQAMESASRRKGYFAVLFFDLDGFKAVNDAYGHHTGDALLIDLAQRIRQTLRTQDTVARLGGDEFIVLSEVVEPTDAANVADRLIDAIARPVTVYGHEVLVTSSVGIAIYPNDGEDIHALLTNADAAMYHAKRLGGTGYSFFEPSMNADAHQQIELLHDLRMALERNQFVLHYQPKYQAPSGPLVGAEALLRWDHPTRGLVGPDQFIPIAEKTGLILPIGEWVIDEACRQMRAWIDAGQRHWSIAVNISALQFAHAGLVETVRAALQRHGVPPACLTLEVTESTAMRDAEASLAVLKRLSALGVAISIDDFGTGYSSLLYLKRLPATELKIDRGFVNQLENDDEDAAIVSAIVALAQQLNLRIVAEGVETAAQQNFLTGLGCDSLQGFLLGKPMPAEDFLEHAAD